MKNNCTLQKRKTMLISFVFSSLTYDHVAVNNKYSDHFILSPLTTLGSQLNSTVGSVLCCYMLTLEMVTCVTCFWASPCIGEMVRRQFKVIFSWKIDKIQTFAFWCFLNPLIMLNLATFAILYYISCHTNYWTLNRKFKLARVKLFWITPGYKN